MSKTTHPRKGADGALCTLCLKRFGVQNPPKFNYLHSSQITYLSLVLDFLFFVFFPLSPRVSNESSPGLNHVVSRSRSIFQRMDSNPDPVEPIKWIQIWFRLHLWLYFRPTSNSVPPFKSEITQLQEPWLSKSIYRQLKF